MKLVEKAFEVLPSAELYKLYFASWEEKNKFHSLAREFFDKYGLLSDDHNNGYYIMKDLRTQLCEADREKYASQLKKLVDKNNMYYFKQNSAMNKAWNAEVSSKCDMDKIDGTWFWYLPFINKGMHSLWCVGDRLYGYLMDEHKDDIQLMEWMRPIKMSEYYAILEETTDG
jgi:hypothetical protein